MYYIKKDCYIFVNFCSHWWLGPCHVGDGLGWFLLFMLLNVGDSLGLLHLCLHMLMWRHDINTYR